MKKKIILMLLMIMTILNVGIVVYANSLVHTNIANDGASGSTTEECTEHTSTAGYSHAWDASAYKYYHYKTCDNCDEQYSRGDCSGGSTWQQGETSHYLICSTCYYGYSYVAHNGGNLGDSYDDDKHYRKCSDCGKAYDGEAHSGGSVTDNITDTEHGKKCTTCSTIYDVAEHSSEKYLLSENMEQHYKICDDCKTNFDWANHNNNKKVPIKNLAGMVNDLSHDTYCKACDFYMGQEIHSWRGGFGIESSSTTDVHNCACGHKHSSKPYHYYAIVGGESLEKEYSCSLVGCDQKISIANGTYVDDMDGLIMEEYVASDATAEMKDVPEIEKKKYTLEWRYSGGTHDSELSPLSTDGKTECALPQLPVSWVTLEGWNRKTIKAHVEGAKDYHKNKLEEYKSSVEKSQNENTTGSTDENTTESGLPISPVGIILAVAGIDAATTVDEMLTYLAYFNLEVTDDYTYEALKEQFSQVFDSEKIAMAKDYTITTETNVISEEKLENWDPLLADAALEVIKENATYEGIVTIEGDTYNIDFTKLPNGGWKFVNYPFDESTGYDTELFRVGSMTPPPPELWYANIYYCYRTKDNLVPLKPANQYLSIYPYTSAVVYNNGPKSATVTVVPDMNLIDRTGYRYIGCTSKVTGAGGATASPYKEEYTENLRTSATVTVSWDASSSAAMVTFFVEPVTLKYGHKAVNFNGEIKDLEASQHKDILEFPDYYDTTENRCTIPIDSLDKFWWPAYILDAARTFEAGTNTTKKLFEKEYTDETTTKFEKGSYIVTEKVPSIYKNGEGIVNETSGFAADKEFYYYYTTPIIDTHHKIYKTNKYIQTLDGENIKYKEQILNEYAYFDSLISDSLKPQYQKSVHDVERGYITFDYSIPQYDLVQIKIYELNKKNDKETEYATLYVDETYDEGKRAYKVTGYNGEFGDYYSTSLNDVRERLKANGILGEDEELNTNKNWKVEFLYKIVNNVHIKFEDLNGDPLLVTDAENPWGLSLPIKETITSSGYTYTTKNLGASGEYTLLKYNLSYGSYNEDVKNVETISKDTKMEFKPGSSNIVNVKVGDEDPTEGTGNVYVILYYNAPGPNNDKQLTIDYMDIETEEIIHPRQIRKPLPQQGYQERFLEIENYEIVGYIYHSEKENELHVVQEHPIIEVTEKDTSVTINYMQPENQHIIMYYKKVEEQAKTVKLECRDVDTGEILPIPPEYLLQKSYTIPEDGMQIIVPTITAYKAQRYVKYIDYDNAFAEAPSGTIEGAKIQIDSNGHNQFIIIYYKKANNTTNLIIEYRKDTPTGIPLRDPSRITLENNKDNPINVPEIQKYVVDYYVINDDPTPKDAKENDTIIVRGTPAIPEQKIIIVYTEQTTDLRVEYRKETIDGPEIYDALEMPLQDGIETLVEVLNISGYTPKFYVKNYGPEVQANEGDKISVIGGSIMKQKIIIVYEGGITTDGYTEEAILAANLDSTGKEEYNVIEAIPTSEDLYIKGQVHSYRFESKITQTPITEPIDVLIRQPYYKDLDDLTKIGHIEIEETVDLTYNYYNIEKAELYDLKGIHLENDAIKYYNNYDYISDTTGGYTEGEANYPPENKSIVPQLVYELPVGHALGSTTTRIQINSTPMYSVSYLNGRYEITINDTEYYESMDQDAMKTQLRNEATKILEDCSKIKVQTLKIRLAGQPDVVILTGNTYNVPKKESALDSPAYHFPYLASRTPVETFHYNKDLYVMEQAKNKIYPTTLNGDYRLIQKIQDTNSTTITTYTQPANQPQLVVKPIDVNGLSVHTPIINNTTMSLNESNIQLNQDIKNGLGTAAVLNLEEKFTIKIPNKGNHRDSDGYGNNKEYNHGGLTANGVEADNSTGKPSQITPKSYDELSTVGVDNSNLNNPKLITTNIKSEQEANGPSFAEYKLIKFPYDVYLQIPDSTSPTGVRPQLFKAKHWYNLYQYIEPSVIEYNFVIPVWVTDATLYSGGNGIHVLVVAENATTDQVNAAMKNPLSVSFVGDSNKANKNAYILRKTFNTYVSGRLYDLQIRDTDDPGYMGKITNALKGKEANDSITEMPIAQRGQVPGYNMGLKLGYRIYFDLKTKGISNDSITIKPKVYYVSKDGAVIKDAITLFYHSRGSMYNKLTEKDLNIRMTMAGTHGLAGNNRDFTKETISAKQLSPSRVFTNQSVIGKIASGITLKRNTEKLPYETINVAPYGFGNNVANFVSSAKESASISEEDITARNEIKNATGHWYGEYYLPASTIVVNGANATREQAMNPANVLTNGYLVVVFEEVTTEDSVNPNDGYLTYDAPTGSLQWADENIERLVLLPSNGIGKIIKMAGEKEFAAPMAIYEVGLRANNDYETEGTH